MIGHVIWLSFNMYSPVARLLDAEILAAGAAISAAGRMPHQLRSVRRTITPTSTVFGCYPATGMERSHPMDDAGFNLSAPPIAI